MPASASRPTASPFAASSAPSAPRLSIEPVADGYIPGVCNIGPWEIRKRRTMGVAGIVAAVVVLVVLMAVGAPRAARLLVLLPAWGGTFSLLQARRRFCGAYAFRRISNFGATYDTVRSVEDDAAHRADLAALAPMLRDSFVVGVIATVIAIALPG